VNSPYRISLKSQWKVEAQWTEEEPNLTRVRSIRVFHSPTGVQANQKICVRFVSLSEETQFGFNGEQQPLTYTNGFAVANVSGLLKAVNQMELIWRVDSLHDPRLPYDLNAWLEISEAINEEQELRSFVDI